MALQRSGSILAADFGSVYTRVVLLDMVDGQYRLVARSTVRSTGGFPFDNVSVGLIRALAELTQITGHRFTDANGRLIQPEGANRVGIDHFVATASTGRPLRAVLVGLVPAISIASGLRAAAGTYVTIGESLSLEDTRDEEAQVNAIISAQPDLILITGGTEGGAEEPVLSLVRTVSLALSLLERAQRPVVLYAGNSALVPQIRTLLDGLTTVFIAGNVRPTLNAEDLDSAQRQLGRAFDEYKSTRGGGFETIARASAVGVLPTAQSLNLITEYLGGLTDREHGALTVDVGSAVSTLSAHYGGEVDTVIRTDLGLGHSAASLLDTLGVEAIRRWLPFNASYAEIASYCHNKGLRPGTVPETLKEVYFEHALLRAALRTLVQTARRRWGQSDDAALDVPLPAFNPLIACGAGLTGTGDAGITALLLLDALQPAGVINLQADPYGLIPALGALAYLRPEVVVQTLDSGSLEDLGTAICVSGEPRAGRPAMKVRITTSLGEVIEHTVNGGELWVYDLPISGHAEIDVRAGRGLRIDGRRRVRLTVEGGTAGIIFDGRGRPLPVAQTAAERAEQFPAWLSQVTGDPVRPIDERWLAPVSDDGPAEPVVVTTRTEQPEPAVEPGAAPAAETPTDDDLFDLEPEFDDELEPENRLRVLGAVDRGDEVAIGRRRRGTSVLSRLNRSEENAQDE